IKVPVFMSSLLQIPFISTMLRKDEKIGIICSKASYFDGSLLENMGVNTNTPIFVRGLEDKENFANAAHEEKGIIDTELIEEEVVSRAKEMVRDDPQIIVILLECSSLPPYADAIQKAVNLPVFDYITMIKYVHSALVQKKHNGYM